MNSFELNKILGAILGTCLIMLALNIGAGAIFAPENQASRATTSLSKNRVRVRRPAQPGAGSADRNAARQGVSGKGQATAKQCQACHTFEKVVQIGSDRICGTS
jgi:cytochrome c